MPNPKKYLQSQKIVISCLKKKLNWNYCSNNIFYHLLMKLKIQEKLVKFDADFQKVLKNLFKYFQNSKKGVFFFISKIFQKTTFEV